MKMRERQALQNKTVKIQFDILELYTLLAHKEVGKERQGAAGKEANPNRATNFPADSASSK